MKTTQGVFLASRFVLGTSHLVFQSLADLSLKAEAKVVERTGYWGVDDKHPEKGMQQYTLSNEQLREYTQARRDHTRMVQSKMSAKYRKLSKMIDDKKKVAFKQV